MALSTTLRPSTPCKQAACLSCRVPADEGWLFSNGEGEFDDEVEHVTSSIKRAVVNGYYREEEESYEAEPTVDAVEYTQYDNAEAEAEEEYAGEENGGEENGAADEDFESY